MISNQSNIDGLPIGHVVVPPNRPKFGCWQTLALVSQTQGMSIYTAQPAGTQNSERADYLLKTIRTDLKSDDRELALVRMGRRLVANELIEHHGIPPILDAELDRSPFYIVEPFVEGHNLKRYGRTLQQVGISRSIWIVRQIAEVLAATHAVQRVHMGLSSQCIMLDCLGKVFITGWGDCLGFGEVLHGTTACGERQNVRAPECYQSDYKAQPGVDIYALGAICYWVFSGVWPFSATSHEEMQHLHQSAIPVALEQRAKQIPQELSRLIHAMLAKNPLRRPTIGNVLEKLFAIEIDHLHNLKLSVE